MHNLNFIPPQRRLGFLQAGTLVALIGCGVMTGLALHGGVLRTATISDMSITTPTPSATPQRIVKPKAISENPVNSVALGTTGDTIRYYEPTGMIFSVDLNTQRTDVISEKRLTDFSQAYWIPNSARVIVALKHPSGTRYQWSDLATGQSGFIGTGNVLAVAPSPDGRSLAYAESSGDTSTVFIGASDGSSPKKLLETRAQDIRLTWPRMDMLLLDSKRDDRPGRDLAAIDMSGNLTVLMTNRENLEYQWSSDGSSFLFSYFSPDQGIVLWYQNSAANGAVPLGVATNAHKCAWHADSTTITCGVPLKSSMDDIITIDTTTGLQTNEYHPSVGTLISVTDPLVSSSGTYFVFTNAFDKRLYLLPL